MSTKTLKLDEIARRISDHLKRFEADPIINAHFTDEHRKGLRPYFRAGAGESGNRVFVQYIAYQGSTGLKKADAIAYLAWLDAGNVGRHYEVK